MASRSNTSPSTLHGCGRRRCARDIHPATTSRTTARAATSTVPRRTSVTSSRVSVVRTSVARGAASSRVRVAGAAQVRLSTVRSTSATTGVRTRRSVALQATVAEPAATDSTWSLPPPPQRRRSAAAVQSQTAVASHFPPVRNRFMIETINASSSPILPLTPVNEEEREIVIGTPFGLRNQQNRFSPDRRPIISCPVCYTTNIEKPLYTMSCGHVFCLECIEISQRCHICRQRIDQSSVHILYI